MIASNNVVDCYSKIQIGADPEIFLARKGKVTGRLYARSAHDLVPGTKKDPHAVSGGAVQADGTAAEFNINPVSAFVNPSTFVQRINSVLGQIDSIVKKNDENVVLDLSTPTRMYPPKNWDSIPDSAKELGCEPDYNAYTGMENPRPVPSKKYERFRTAGGHIHIGWANGLDVTNACHILDCMNFTRVLDMVLLPLSKLWDTDETRRVLYGKPGSFRPKSYGMEYRPLSNAWLRSDTSKIFVYYGVQASILLLRYWVRDLHHSVLSAPPNVDQKNILDLSNRWWDIFKHSRRFNETIVLNNPGFSDNAKAVAALTLINKTASWQGSFSYCPDFFGPKSITYRSSCIINEGACDFTTGELLINERSAKKIVDDFREMLTEKE